MAITHEPPGADREQVLPRRTDPLDSSPLPSGATAPEGERPPNAPAKLIFGLASAQLGVFLAVLTPVTVTLALRVAQIVPPSERGTSLGRVLSVGAVLAMIANPLFGALSDRTTSRLGRRRPWLIGGMAVGFIGLATIAFGTNVPMLTVGWALAQLGCNAALAAVTSCVPDLVPEHQRARVSGIIGMMMSVALVLGSFLANAFSRALALAFLVPGVIGLVAVVFLAVVMKDRPARPGAFAPYSLKEFLHSFWVNPRKHPDFAWNFAGRFLVFVGISCVTSYQVYFLMDRLGFSQSEVAGKMFTGTLLMVSATVVGSLLGGFLSDHSGRRKPYVLSSAVVLGLGLILVAFAQSFTVFLVAITVFGFGQGLYMAVDMALAAAVLPDPEHSAKDMGVLNIGNSLPQSLVPIIAPALLAIGGGGNYGALFLFGGIAAALGAVAVQFVRAVK